MKNQIIFGNTSRTGLCAATKEKENDNHGPND